MIDIQGTTVNIDATSIMLKGGIMTHVPGGGGGGGSGNSGSADFAQSEIGKYAGFVFNPEEPIEESTKPKEEAHTEQVATSPAEETPVSPAPGADIGHYVMIKTLDDNNQPLAGEPYEVKLADGTIKKGVVDETGFALIDKIPGTDVLLTLTNRDGQIKKV